ncbi:MAG: hypothetical protein KKF30_16075 [Proteobacteria bacterium]|nr:hypothetical protein [Pseudomonadota bacterium]MBU4472058.1 hypothetical protein [Pseudomonadota bacterium]MCG2752943.1 hypothetical protein [Desulfobacteraceae bacterium]
MILSLFGKNYVLNGYLAVDRKKNEISLIAQTELGGTAFEIYFEKDVKEEINIKIDSFKKEWLEKSALKDLRNIYLPEPLLTPLLFSDPNGTWVLYQEDGKLNQEYVYKKTPDPEREYQLAEIHHVKNHKPFYSIRFSYNDKKLPQYPDFISIENKKMHYSLKISVKYLTKKD